MTSIRLAKAQKDGHKLLITKQLQLKSHSCRVRRKRQRLTSNGSIESAPASVSRDRMTLSAGALPIEF